MPTLLLSAALALLAVGPAAAATVNVLWTGSPRVGGTTIDLQVGDTIEWDVLVGHDLSEMPNQALFDACDFTGSNLISIGPAVTDTTFTTPGTHYYLVQRRGRLPLRPPEHEGHGRRLREPAAASAVGVAHRRGGRAGPGGARRAAKTQVDLSGYADGATTAGSGSACV